MFETSKIFYFIINICKFDPKAIKRAFVIDTNGNEKPVAIGLDKEASSKGGLFIEFNAEEKGVYIVAVEYERGF